MHPPASPGLLDLDMIFASSPRVARKVSYKNNSKNVTATALEMLHVGAGVRAVHWHAGACGAAALTLARPAAHGTRGRIQGLFLD